jgi:hypothetical protein
MRFVTETLDTRVPSTSLPDEICATPVSVKLPTVVTVNVVESHCSHSVSRENEYGCDCPGLSVPMGVCLRLDELPNWQSSPICNDMIADTSCWAQLLVRVPDHLESCRLLVPTAETKGFDSSISSVLDHLGSPEYLEYHDRSLSRRNGNH